MKKSEREYKKANERFDRRAARLHAKGWGYESRIIEGERQAMFTPPLPWQREILATEIMWANEKEFRTATSRAR